jgi:uncharacterized membrane protein
MVLDFNCPLFGCSLYSNGYSTRGSVLFSQLLINFALVLKCRFFQLIRNRVRIPLKDDFLTTRISGPGMASQHYYQIKPPQALATLEARMDRDKLKQFGVSVTIVVILHSMHRLRLKNRPWLE